MGEQRARGRLRALRWLPSRQWVLPGLGVMAVAAGCAAAVGFGGVGQGDDSSGTSTLPPGTATVTRADLVDYLDVSGTLGYGPASALTARAIDDAAGGGTAGATGTSPADGPADGRGTGAAGTSGSSGTAGASGTSDVAGGGIITALADVGATVGRGQPLYFVDTRPIVLLYGAVPAYRALRAGVAGDDVRQLEENLRALGYRGFTVDKTFGAATTTAVRRWQTDLGLPVTGVVPPGRIVYASGPIRIATHTVEAGAEAAGEVLTFTGTTKLVLVNLKVENSRLAVQDAPVTVTMGGVGSTPGTIVKVGTVATAVGDGAGGGQQNADLTIPVTIQLTDQAQQYPYDGAPVTVRLTAQTRSRVLCVPVEALLALREGGFGVEVIEHGTTRIVPVTVGLFANGRVEIVEGDLTEGTAVGVPK
ncbi:MAG: peptidoglycan-binding protein [Dactylosporangium sp.]|nr:peptidoglycan-binding protein [Dactylosporangium sp.]NNJ60827.1 peptidoglycan-binding protein [Dactylosporangium sp.]